MKKLNEETTLSAGNAISLMVFIELAYYVEKQRGTLGLAFPQLGNRGLYKLFRKFSSNPTYMENKDQLLGMSERFFNNSSLKSLYKTLAYLGSNETEPSEIGQKMEDINRVFSKIERTINGKLTSEEKELFSSMEDVIDNYSEKLNSMLNSSIETSPSKEELPSEEEPISEPKPEEKPTEEPKSDEETSTEPEQKKTTEEQFRGLIKKLVKETLQDYEKRFGKL